MEVLGLALGLYPVVILAFEQFKTGSDYFSNWKRFRRQYEGFLSDIAGQRLLFEGILQDLLCGGLDPYLSRVKSKEEFLRIVSDKSYIGWSDPKLTENLKARLGKSYKWYMDTVGRIYDIFKDFEKIIDIPALESSNRAEDRWKYQWERVKKSLFDKERYEMRETAARLIDELKKVLELSNMQPLPQEKEQAISSIVPFLNRVRNNAFNLHEALKNAWHCHCNSTHKALLQLERREHERESDFNILFVLRKHLRHDSDTSKGDNTELEVKISCIEREVTVKFINKLNDEECNENKIEQNERAAVESSQPGPEISTPISPPSSDSSNTPLSSPWPVARSAKSYSSAQPAASSEKSKATFFQGLIKWGSKSRSLMNSPVAMKQFHETKPFRAFDSTPLLDVKNRNQDLNNSTNFKRSDAFIAISSAETTIGDNSSTQVAAQLSVSRLEGASKSRNEELTLSKNVAEVNQPANIQRPIKPGYPILPVESQTLDLCNTIQYSEANTCLDHPIDTRKEYLRFLLGPKIVRQKEGSISLQELLEGDPHYFPPAKRALVATILASSLLQLQWTQWIKDGWSKRDIYFRTQNGVVIFEQLYLSKEFASTDDTEKESTYSVETGLAASIASTITGSTLMATTAQMTNSFSSVQPLHLKTSLECLGIVLIELCFGEPIEQGKDKVKVQPQGPITKEPNHDFCLSIANKWTWQEISAWDSSFANPIDMCLRFPRLGRADEGRYDEIVQDMYSAIVKPLQDGMSKRW